jgi:glutamyl-tRNA synthetase
LRLHEARGWTPPRFVYLPPVVWPTGNALASASVHLLRARGYLAPAVVNHLARLGWSPRGKRALLSLSALAQHYDLGRLARKPVAFRREQLDWFNRRYLASLDRAALVRLFVPYWRDAYGLAHRAEGTALGSDEWQQTLAVSVREEVCALPEVVDRVHFAFVDRIKPGARSGPATRMLAQAYAPEVLSAFVEAIAGVEPFGFAPIDALVSDLRWRFRASHGIRSRDVMHVIRAALTGRLDGPCLVDACRLLGRRRCVERARCVLVEVGHA